MNAPKTKSSDLPTCFIAMPISNRGVATPPYADEYHWAHVMENLFVKAVKNAGFRAIPPVAEGSQLIHGQIVKHLSEADLVLCDLSSDNPNVFFELGVRTSLNLPIALVQDGTTPLPFDTSPVNTHFYNPNLTAWDIESEQARLAKHLQLSAKTCDGTNPMWERFGLTVRAKEPDTYASPLEAKVDLLTDRLSRMQSSLELVTRLRGQEPGPSGNGALLFSGGAAQDDRQALPSSGASPSARFETFVKHYASERKLRASIYLLSPREANVAINDAWRESDVEAVFKSAQEHGVELNLVRTIVQTRPEPPIREDEE